MDWHGGGASGPGAEREAAPRAVPRRMAVVDLGSNSVRLVVFEGLGRTPAAVFNEKAVLRLGRGLQTTGRLNAEGCEQALLVLQRYGAVAKAMGAHPFEILATAAVRDAENGPEFVAKVRELLPGVPITVLPGREEAALSAAGVLCGIPAADGVLADIGGGSLELVELRGGRMGRAHSLKLGVIRLAERSGGDPARARAVAETDLAAVDWLREGAGRDLYMVGGAWRAMARIHMAQTGYPLNIVHHYIVARDEARDLAGVVAAGTRRALERLPGAPRRRLEDLPYAAVVLRRLLRGAAPRRIVFSANGIREGWYMRSVPEGVAALDPLLAAGRDMAEALARDMGLPPALVEWTAPLFPAEGPESARLREAACWVSDIGAHDHPEYRAEQAFLRVLRQPGVALDHYARAFLALALAIRYEAEPDAPFLFPARALLDMAGARRAEVLGMALRLAYTLSAGTPDLLAPTSLRVDGGRLVLHLGGGQGVFAGDAVLRRLDRLALAVGLDSAVEMD